MKLLLIRHPEVAPEFKNICYGQSDVALKDGWKQSLDEAIAELSLWQEEYRPSLIWHSNLQRTLLPAVWIANELNQRWGSALPTVAGSDDLRERDYGSWQGQRWDAIAQDEVMQVHDTIYQPDTYRPGGGETTTEMQSRATRWLGEARSGAQRSIVAIAHSGTIAAIAGAIKGKHPKDWTPYYMKPSQALELEI